MSMIGLAARPGTDVEPTCSSCSARPPSAAPTRADSTAKSSGQRWLYASRTIGPAFSAGSPTVTRRSRSWALSGCSLLIAWMCGAPPRRRRPGMVSESPSRGKLSVCRPDTHRDLIMEPLTPLARHAEALPPDWKWLALFAPPAEHLVEWRTWLAQAQRAEQAATLHYWSARVDRAA